MTYDVAKIRGDFPILSSTVNGHRLVYLDNAATAQKPRCVIDSTAELYRTVNSNIHRGVHTLSSRMTERYESARETVRRFINAASADQIVFTSGATASINLVAYSLGELLVGQGDNIVVSEIEHHSNIVPWQLLCERKGASLRILRADENGVIHAGELIRLMDERTRLVAVTQASNVLGTIPDLAGIIASAHGCAVPVLVDGCQGIVHGKTDVTAMDCDFYVFSGHKLYGPTGTGVLYGKRRWLEQMPPFMGGGDMVSSVSFQKTVYAPLPFKFEAGTANYIGAAGMADAIEYLERIGSENIYQHEQHLLEYALSRLSEVEGLTVYGVQPHKCPIISFNIDRVHPYDMGMVLDKLGIAVRTGTHCAEPVMQKYSVEGMCRASFALYNNTDDVDALVAGIQRASLMLR